MTQTIKSGDMSISGHKLIPWSRTVRVERGERVALIDTSWDRRGYSAAVHGPAVIKIRNRGSASSLALYAVRCARGGRIEDL